MTAPTDAQWQGMTKLLLAFFQRADAEPFRVPVDWKALGLYDYPQIIKKPVDLGSIKKKIAARKYSTILEAAEDIRLVWTNCMTYNADGSDFFMLAKTLNKKWDEKYAKFLTEYHVADTGAPGGSGSGSGGADGGTANSSKGGGGDKISLDDKKAFAKNLFKLTKEDLGKVIVEVDTKCPQALVKNNLEDECELNIDKLTPALFGELRAYIATCGTSSNQPPKKKKKV